MKEYKLFDYTCPYCEKDVESWKPDTFIIVRTKRKTVLYVHTKCIEDNKRGNKNGVFKNQK